MTTTRRHPMAERLLSGAGRALDPVDRFGEVIFGLIMVLTFTGSISVATSGRQEIRELLIGALGCNIAWGIVDAVMFVVTSIAYRSRQALVREVVQQADGDTARALVRAELPEALEEALDDAAVDGVVGAVRRHGAAPAPGRFSRDDLRGAVAVFLLVVLATIPVALPFVVMHDVGVALRTSNAVALVMLFLAGYSLGRAMGLRPLAVGLGMMVLGAALVAVTMALGG